MKRREFLALVGGAAAALPLAAHAQQKIPRVGVLLVAGPELMGPFPQAMRELGYVEGKNIQIETLSAKGQTSLLPELAADLVRRKVDVIVASLTPAVAAARHATSDIPIVMAPAGDPVGTGLVSSLARPGGNITGLSGTAAELSAKTLELVREFLPSASRVAVLNPIHDPFAKSRMDQIRQGARLTRFEIGEFAVRDRDEVAAAFAAIAAQRFDAVLLPAPLPVQFMVELALRHRVPALSAQKAITEAGGLASYSARYAEFGREIARYVDRILKGAKPADLPVQQPSTFELVINLRTAKALGLTLSPALLARADEVIE